MACSALLITTCFGKLQLLIFPCLAPKDGVMSPYSNFPAEYMRTFGCSEWNRSTATDVPAPRDWREDYKQECLQIRPQRYTQVQKECACKHTGVVHFTPLHDSPVVCCLQTPCLPVFASQGLRLQVCNTLGTCIFSWARSYRTNLFQLSSMTQTEFINMVPGSLVALIQFSRIWIEWSLHSSLV